MMWWHSLTRKSVSGTGEKIVPLLDPENDKTNEFLINSSIFHN
jgi:hypothetical protein